LFKVKEGENFNHRNTQSISRNELSPQQAAGYHVGFTIVPPMIRNVNISDTSHAASSGEFKFKI
jgi:hypothetical protein